MGEVGGDRFTTNALRAKKVKLEPLAPNAFKETTSFRIFC